MNNTLPTLLSFVVVSLTFVTGCGDAGDATMRTTVSRRDSGAMMPPPDGAMMMPPPDGAMMMPPPDGAMMMPPGDAGTMGMPPGDGGAMGMPRSCTTSAECTGACPPGSTGCTCAMTMMGLGCVPSCARDSDCPTPPMGTLRCESSRMVCVPSTMM